MTAPTSAIFCHGLESGPIGRKSQALRDAGIPLQAPDFRGMVLAERVEKLLGILRDRSDVPLLIGSSYGGITALCAAILLSEEGRPAGGLLLCAPALGRAEPPADSLFLRAPVATHIIHGTRDEVVPVEVSRQFAAVQEAVVLEEVDDDHSLAGSIDRIVELSQTILASP